MIDAILREVEDFLRRFVVFSTPAQVTALALWVAHTYVLEAAETTPYMIITSATKRCGKSLLLDILELLVYRPWRVACPSEAVVFRKISADKPTLLLDEADAIFGPKAANYEGLRALLNAGHRRGTKVPRCVGEGSKIRVEDFEVFCPKAVAGIGGNLPDTVTDRGPTIQLLRRGKHEPVERFRYREAQYEAADIRDALAGWATEEVVETLQNARPKLPEPLNDRAADAWEPLWAVADCAGARRGAEARQAALELSGSDSSEETVGVLLLGHLRDVFASTESDKLPTEEILQALVQRDDGPWADWWSAHVDKGETKGPASRLARLVKPFNVSPTKIRIDDTRTARGYQRLDLESIWERYLPPVPPPSLEKTEQGHFGPEKEGSDQDCSNVPLVPFSGGGGEGTRNGELPLEEQDALIREWNDPVLRGS